MRPRKEVLVGDQSMLDYLARKHQTDIEPHPLQERIEAAVSSMLTEDEQEIFWLRYGENLPIRAIATALGYTSHQIIQVKIARINQKVKEYLDVN
jgi:DNA-directed RNA polymerase specialized sigma subunit